MPEETRPDVVALRNALQRTRPFLILSPPRSASTALARCLTNHPDTGPYIHEPFDRMAHEGAPPSSVLARLENGGLEKSSVLKEMTFQLADDEMGHCFLAEVRKPIIVPLRAPLLTIESRLRMVLQDLATLETTSPLDRDRISTATAEASYAELDDLVTESLFPTAFTGWAALRQQLALCRRQGWQYVIVESRFLRARPHTCLRRLCTALDLEFSPSMLAWQEVENQQLGGLAGQTEWYRGVSESTGVLPETETLVSADSLPNHLARHLPFAQEVYAELLEDPHNLPTD